MNFWHKIRGKYKNLKEDFLEVIRERLVARSSQYIELDMEKRGLLRERKGLRDKLKIENYRTADAQREAERIREKKAREKEVLVNDYEEKISLLEEEKIGLELGNEALISRIEELENIERGLLVKLNEVPELSLNGLSRAIKIFSRSDYGLALVNSEGNVEYLNSKARKLLKTKEANKVPFASFCTRKKGQFSVGEMLRQPEKGIRKIIYFGGEKEVGLLSRVVNSERIFGNTNYSIVALRKPTKAEVKKEAEVITIEFDGIEENLGFATEEIH